MTLVPPGRGAAGAGPGDSGSLPRDLMEQVRGRLGLIALLLFIAFAFDPLMLLGRWIYAQAVGTPLEAEASTSPAFLALSLTAAAASLAVWWMAQRRDVPAARLHTLGLVYEAATCFVVAVSSNWQQWIDESTLPHLTWVPTIVILFPLILPGPPRRMLLASLVAGAMAPLALLVLAASGRIEAHGEAYASAVVASTFAVIFASMGARVIYRLGRDVVAARELGSYHLEELLGRGGMGEVWRAHHRLLARPAAIKLIQYPGAAGTRASVSEEVLRRFEREARATASLRSPHTVNVFDFGVTEDGSFYYVMELLEGLDANTLVRRFGPVPAARAVHLIGQVCHSLSEAESRGLVHRDIKPANVFVCRYGEDVDFVKVLDFGLVKALADARDGAADLTAENAIHGTPAFMSPEQALGRLELDHRVDIYATGCLAYWLLTGELVFEAPSPTALLVHHAHTPPPPPSTRTELPIPEALDRLVLECLEKDPVRRPASARDLARRLAETVPADGWTEAHAQEWWAQHQPARARVPALARPAAP